MILWIVQHKIVWDKLCSERRYKTDGFFVDEYHIVPYNWMVLQMERRIGPKPPDVKFPVWGWYQWEDARRKMPDLRCSSHLPKGTEGVRLKINIDDCKVLLSDFETWHYVLNYWYLAQSEADFDRFEQELKKNNLEVGQKELFQITMFLPDLQKLKRMMSRVLIHS